VPTAHGSTDVPVSEFDGWPVHLLGGSPHAQHRLTHYLHAVSADGNIAPGAQIISLYTLASGTRVALTNAEFTNSSVFQIVAIYEQT